MEIDFYKYHGTGNDFIMIDNRGGAFPKNNTSLVQHICDRRFGVGGDGLILLEDDKNSDFRMVYYNSDGNQSSMCGNGGRCIVAFAKKLGIINEDTTEFIATDGLHDAIINIRGFVTLRMKDVADIKMHPQHIFLDTGSPHHIEFVEDLRNIDIKKKGAEIRYSQLYGETGSNVNFVKPDGTDIFSVRTYERGVEDETLSCGTGAVAVAIAAHALRKTTATTIHINVEGGKLEVSFNPRDGIYTDVFLSGPAEFVFKGTLNIEQWQH